MSDVETKTILIEITATGKNIGWFHFDWVTRVLREHSQPPWPDTARSMVCRLAKEGAAQVVKFEEPVAPSPPAAKAPIPDKVEWHDGHRVYATPEALEAASVELRELLKCRDADLAEAFSSFGDGGTPGHLWINATLAPGRKAAGLFNSLSSSEQITAIKLLTYRVIGTQVSPEYLDRHLQWLQSYQPGGLRSKTPIPDESSKLPRANPLEGFVEGAGQASLTVDTGIVKRTFKGNKADLHVLEQFVDKDGAHDTSPYWRKVTVTFLVRLVLLLCLSLGLKACVPVCQVKQSRCNGPLVEVCSGGKWRRFADCSQILKLEDGKVVKGGCRVREATKRVGCLREDEK